MLRWLARLLFIGLILAAIGFVVSRLLGQDDEFDDFDDIDEGFDFQETPVEIDVPAEDNSTPRGKQTADLSMSAGQGSEGSAAQDDNSVAADDTPAPDGNGADTQSAEGGAATETAEAKLSDIKGIGPAYEAGLHAMGIESFDDLINSDAASLSEQLGVIGGQSTVEDWVSQARDLASGGSPNDGNNS